MSIAPPICRIEPASSNYLMMVFIQWLLSHLAGDGNVEQGVKVALHNLFQVLEKLRYDAFTGEDGAWQDIGPATKAAFAEVYGTENQGTLIDGVEGDLKALNEGNELPEDRKTLLRDFLQKLSQGIPLSNQ